MILFFSSFFFFPLSRNHLLPHRSILDTPDAFDELYCLVFQLFDLTWTQKNGTYMQFNVISEATKQRLNAVLEKHPSSLHQFATLLQAECMSLYELWLLSSPSVPAGSVARGKRIVYKEKNAPPPVIDPNEKVIHVRHK